MKPSSWMDLNTHIHTHAYAHAHAHTHKHTKALIADFRKTTSLQYVEIISN